MRRLLLLGEKAELLLGLGEKAALLLQSSLLRCVTSACVTHSLRITVYGWLGLASMA